MRKSEFMDLLKYYFRNADKDDLKGIIKDCEEQFRLGTKSGKSEEEVCVELGSPKNIYRYYIGKPIVPEDNPRLPGDDTHSRRRRVPSHQAYDWEKDPAHQRRRAQSAQYYRDASRYYEDSSEWKETGRHHKPSRHKSRPSRPRGGEDFDWSNDEQLKKTGNAIARPLLDIAGTLLNVVTGMMYSLLFIAILATLFLTFMPDHLFFGLVPMPPISLETMIFFVLAILFGAMTTSSAATTCHKAAKGGGTRD